MELNNLLKSSSSNTGALIFLLIFFGIIFVLIIVAVIGSKKDKVDRMIKNDEKLKIKNQALENRAVIFGSLNQLLITLEKDIKDFKPSIGTRSLGEINREFSSIIDFILNSRELKEVYYDEDFKNEMSPIFKELKKAKPSNWEKDAQFALNLIRAKSLQIKKGEETKENYKKGLKKKWN